MDLTASFSDDTGMGATIAVLDAVTWNPSDKASGVVLSNGNLTATVTVASGVGGWGAVRGTQSHNRGKKYLEFFIPRVSDAIPLVGLQPHSRDLTAHPFGPGGSIPRGTQSNGGAGTNVYFSLAVDFGTGEYKFRYKSDETGWEDWAADNLLSPGTEFYPYAWLQPPDTGDAIVTINTGASAFQDPEGIPAGYASWDGWQGSDVESALNIPQSVVLVSGATFNSGAALWSDDLATWVEGTTPTTGNDTNWSAVCYAPSLQRFVAVAANSPQTGGGVMYSDDGGRTWTNANLSSGHTCHSVCWSEELSKFVAVANLGAVLTSPDGVTWSTFTITGGGTLQSVCWAKEIGLFAVVSSAGATPNYIFTSPDGETWTPRASAADSWTQHPYAIAWSGALFCVVGPGQSHTVTSPDGVTWTDHAAGLGTTTNWNSICWSETRQEFCAVGSVGDGSSAVSPNGTAFTVSANLAVVAAGSTPRVAYSDWHQKYIAVGGSSLIALSDDGLTWTNESQPSGGPGVLQAVAVGYDPNVISRAVTFTDDGGLSATITVSVDALDLSATFTDDLGLDATITVLDPGDLSAIIRDSNGLTAILDVRAVRLPIQMVVLIE